MPTGAPWRCFRTRKISLSAGCGKTVSRCMSSGGTPSTINRSQAGGTRNVRLTGMPAGTLCVTEVVPAVASGPEVIDYAGAFKKNLLAAGDGGLDLTLGDSPVVVELPPPSRRRAVSR